jgi:DNA-binding transcriptional LysR family regulator
MELRHLRYFLAVAEHQSFRKASQALRISHPSLCAQIIDLEQEVGARLFERTNRHVFLTVPGHTFLAGARRTLKCAIQTVEKTQQASKGHHDPLRIANVGLICPSLLAQLIRAFRERYLTVQISVLQQNKLAGIEAVLEKGGLCIGCLAPESKSRRIGTLKSWVVATGPVGVAVAKTHGNNKNSPAKLKDFANETFLILDPKYAPGYLDWVRSVFRQTRFDPAKMLAVDSAESFFTLLAAGAGIALLSPLHFEGRREGVSFRKLTETIADFPLSLMWDQKRASPLVNNFLEVAREVLSNTNGTLILEDHNRALSARVERFAGVSRVAKDQTSRRAMEYPAVKEVFV